MRCVMPQHSALSYAMAMYAVEQTHRLFFCGRGYVRYRTDLATDRRHAPTLSKPPDKPVTLSTTLSSTQTDESADARTDLRTVPNSHNHLSHAEAQRFHQQGFLVVPELCDRDEMHEIRTTLQTLFQQQTGRNEGNQFDMLSLDREGSQALQPQILKPSLYAPALLRTPFHQRVRAMAVQLLGPDAEFVFDHSILKPAGSAAATPWHQDEAHGHDPRLHYEQISFWMPLQDVSIQNGCMRYVPGSNLGPLLPHRSLNDDPRIHAIECPSDYFDASTARAQPVRAGTCILHSGRTLHSALPNRSAADRLVYVIAFRGPPVPRHEPVTYTWLDSKRTAGIERREQWHRRGGFWVLLARQLRQLLLSDIRALALRLQRSFRQKRPGLPPWRQTSG